MMKKKLLLLFLSTIILVTGFVTVPAEASPDTELGTDPLPCTAQVGTRQNVGITITDVANLYVWQFNMTFNPAVLAVVNITEGPFLHDASGYSTRWLPPEIHNETGWAGAACTLAQPFPDWGAEGSGVLANITFYVKAKGKSDLHFAGIGDSTYLREWDIWNKVLIDIPFTPHDGFFVYSPRVQGDVDGDGIVNAIDLFGLGRAYNSMSGGPGWNPDADINKDNTVNKQDLSLLANNYGTDC